MKDSDLAVSHKNTMIGVVYSLRFWLVSIFFGLILLFLFYLFNGFLAMAFIGLILLIGGLICLSQPVLCLNEQQLIIKHSFSKLLKKNDDIQLIPSDKLTFLSKGKISPSGTAGSDFDILFIIYEFFIRMLFKQHNIYTEQGILHTFKCDSNQSEIVSQFFKAASLDYSYVVFISLNKEIIILDFVTKKMTRKKLSGEFAISDSADWTINEEITDFICRDGGEILTIYPPVLSEDVKKKVLSCFSLR